MRPLKRNEQMNLKALQRFGFNLKMVAQNNVRQPVIAYGISEDLNMQVDLGCRLDSDFFMDIESKYNRYKESRNGKQLSITI